MPISNATKKCKYRHKAYNGTESVWVCDATGKIEITNITNKHQVQGIFKQQICCGREHSDCPLINIQTKPATNKELAWDIDERDF